MSKPWFGIQLDKKPLSPSFGHITNGNLSLTLSAIIAILIFDISNKQSFENVQKWLEEIHMHGNEAIRIILIGNKSDLNDLGKRAVTTEEAELLAATNGFKYI